jgi:hypothetical protein
MVILRRLFARGFLSVVDALYPSRLGLSEAIIRLPKKYAPGFAPGAYRDVCFPFGSHHQVAAATTAGMAGRKGEIMRKLLVYAGLYFAAQSDALGWILRTGQPA